MSCKTWISIRRGKIPLHALEDHEVYDLLRQAEQERAVITRRIRAGVFAWGWDEDEEELQEATVRRLVAADEAATTLYQTITALFQEASRRRPIQQKLDLVRYALEGTFAKEIERREWMARTMPEMFGEE